MKEYGGLDVWLHLFLASAFTLVCNQIQAPTAILPGIWVATHAIGGWVGAPGSVNSLKEKQMLLHL